MIVVSASKEMNSCYEANEVHINKLTMQLLNYFKSLSKDDLGIFFKIKSKTLDNTYNYYQNNDYSNRAIDVYNGISFRQITTRKNLNELHIISALYGIVDANSFIYNYRLDFSKKVNNINLYDYFKEYVENYINKIDDKYLLNLASNEYFKLIEKCNLNKVIINVMPIEKLNSVELKKMRGSITNYCLENNVKDYTTLNNIKINKYNLKFEDNIIHVTIGSENG